MVSDDTGRLRVVCLGNRFTKTLHGDTVYFSGKVTGDMFGAVWWVGV